MSDKKVIETVIKESQLEGKVNKKRKNDNDAVIGWVVFIVFVVFIVLGIFS